MVAILDEIVSFNLFGRILASVPVQGRTDIFEQRIEFMKIRQEDRDKIIKFIFEREFWIEKYFRKFLLFFAIVRRGMIQRKRKV